MRKRENITWYDHYNSKKYESKDYMTKLYDDKDGYKYAINYPFTEEFIENIDVGDFMNFLTEDSKMQKISKHIARCHTYSKDEYRTMIRNILGEKEKVKYMCVNKNRFRVEYVF